MLVIPALLLVLVGCGDDSNSGGINLSGVTLPEDNPAVAMYIEGHGTIVVELFPEDAPLTVENFVGLVDDGFYDGLTFHRIIPDFMMQGGDPEGTGMGGSGTNIVGEFAANGIDNPILHTRGVISMARSMDFDSASSQFFIMHEDSSFLDGEYAAFGEVISGIEVVDSVVESVTPDPNGAFPEDHPVIGEARVVN